jgi:hypothetical protein
MNDLDQFFEGLRARVDNLRIIRLESDVDGRDPQEWLMAIAAIAFSEARNPGNIRGRTYRDQILQKLSDIASEAVLGVDSLNRINGQEFPVKDFKIEVPKDHL